MEIRENLLLKLSEMNARWVKGSWGKRGCELGSLRPYWIWETLILSLRRRTSTKVEEKCFVW